MKKTEKKQMNQVSLEEMIIANSMNGWILQFYLQITKKK